MVSDVLRLGSGQTLPAYRGQPLADKQRNSFSPVEVPVKSPVLENSHQSTNIAFDVPFQPPSVVRNASTKGRFDQHIEYKPTSLIDRFMSNAFW